MSPSPPTIVVIKHEIDTKYLFYCSLTLTPTAIRIYFLLLSRLVSNDEAIYFQLKEIKTALGVYRRSMQPTHAIKELERAELVSRPPNRYNYYYINPKYARKQ